jgi:disulfide bond formation protein DsbB
MMFNAISPKLFAIFIVGMSALALAGALIGQYGFGLHPCDLCVYQRIPFVLNIILGLLGYFWVSKQKPIIAMSGILFFINSGIAMFHSGVERKWWAGLTGCSTPDMSGSIEDLLKRIQATDVVRCDEIPWSLFGLSMANYNVAFCLGMGVLCIFYVLKARQSR